jgi:hypothetical protein
MHALTAVAYAATLGDAMPRARNIKPRFFVNDELCEMHPLARLLFAGLWCVADRAGRLEDRPKRIKLEVLPADDCDVDAMLSDLQARGFVVRYEVEGLQLVEICNWSKHQNPHHTEKHSVFPPASDVRAVVKPLKQNELSTLTVNSPSENGKCPADSLIPDSLIPDSNIQRHTSPSRSLENAEMRESVSQVFNHWQRVMHKPRASLDEKRRNIIRKALAHYTVTDLCLAIDGCNASAWHMGDNDKGRKFDGLDLILRDAGKIDAFMAMRDAPPPRQRPLTVAEQRAETIAGLTGRNKRNDA